MGIKQDVFGLEQIYRLQIEGQWSTKGDVFLSPSPFTAAHPFGYFAGGSPGPKSTVDRIDYSNDTADASPKGPLSATRYALAATGNQNFGYFAGGNPGPVSTIDRLDYANDDVTASPKGELSINRHTMGACSAGANALPQ